MGKKSKKISENKKKNHATSEDKMHENENVPKISETGTTEPTKSPNKKKSQQNKNIPEIIEANDNKSEMSETPKKKKNKFTEILNKTETSVEISNTESNEQKEEVPKKKKKKMKQSENTQKKYLR